MSFSIWVAVLLAGCGGPTKPLDLSWQFADGRDCDSSGATSVQVSANGKQMETTCAAGLTPEIYQLAEVTRDGTLTANALSRELAMLYSGSIDLDDTGGSVLITLYAVAAR